MYELNILCTNEFSTVVIYSRVIRLKYDSCAYYLNCDSSVLSDDETCHYTVSSLIKPQPLSVGLSTLYRGYR